VLGSRIHGFDEFWRKLSRLWQPSNRRTLSRLVETIFVCPIVFSLCSESQDTWGTPLSIYNLRITDNFNLYAVFGPTLRSAIKYIVIFYPSIEESASPFVRNVKDILHNNIDWLDCRTSGPTIDFTTLLSVRSG
jgi:hypothetical protein